MKMPVSLLLLLFLIGFGLLCLKLITKPKSKKAQRLSEITVTRRRPLSAYEEQMFYVLSGALPDCIVLAQVAFSALITSKSPAIRNRFDRKVADFVICSRQMTPILIIELDDASHKGKELQDAERDALLKNAGYTTIRYTKIPSEQQVQKDLEILLLAAAHKAPLKSASIPAQ